jgi:hypothetical protein
MWDFFKWKNFKLISYVCVCVCMCVYVITLHFYRFSKWIHPCNEDSTQEIEHHQHWQSFLGVPHAKHRLVGSILQIYKNEIINYLFFCKKDLSICILLSTDTFSVRVNSGCLCTIIWYAPILWVGKKG